MSTAVLEHHGALWDYECTKEHIFISRLKPLMTVVIYPNHASTPDWEFAHQLGFHHPYPYFPNLEPIPQTVRNFIPRIRHCQRLCWQGEYWEVREDTGIENTWLIENLEMGFGFGTCGDAGRAARTLSALGFQMVGGAS